MKEDAQDAAAIAEDRTGDCVGGKAAAALAEDRRIRDDQKGVAEAVELEVARR